MMAELQRAPFDLLEAEQELSAGFNVEYSGMRFGMFFMAEYMKMIIFSAIIAVLFLAVIAARLWTSGLVWAFCT